MPPTSRPRPLIHVALAAFVWASVLAPSAHAAEPPVLVGPEPVHPCPKTKGCGFSVSTPMGAVSATTQPGGKAVASGTIGYSSAYRVRTVVDRVADVCNSKGTGDGLAAYFYVDLLGTRGEIYNLIRRPTAFKDTNGCDRGSRIASSLSLDMKSTGVRVKQIRARVCVGDPRENGTIFRCTTGAWKDNPYT